MNLKSSKKQLSDSPVGVWSLLLRREVQVVFLVVVLLILVPILFNYSQRAERIGRAILNNHDETAQKIIIKYPKLLDSRDSRNGFTPLTWAVIAGRTNLFFWLMEKGADVNIADPSGMTALHKAAIFNRVSCAETLIVAGANISALGRKYGALWLMPIHLAAEEGHADMVKELLNRGADVNSPTEGANRITPLHFAAARGNAVVVETLIASGADINAYDLAKKTPLTWAIESEHQNTADILRDAGAVP